MSTSEYEYLALIINYEEFLGKTLLKEEYFEGKNKTMFHILKDEYDKKRALVFSELCKIKNFDSNYYIELKEANLYTSSRKQKFKILEQNIISEYKVRKINEEIKKFHGNIEEFFNNIDDIRKMNILENEDITAEKILKVLESKETQIKLGYSSLDKNLYIFKNDFVVIAGGTGTGKTTFALNLLSNMSKENKCVYFNMEMSEKVLYRRLTAIETGIDITKLNNIEKLDENEMKKVSSKVTEISEREITLINGSKKIEDIEKIISRIDTDKKIIVFLDHIGLINGKGNNQYEKMTEIAKRIRGLCFDYDCTIFGLCQLSRESQKEEKEPKLQDLRDSGEIEQSARKVLLLYNKDLKNQNEIKDIELIIDKNDAGTRMVKPFKFDIKKQRFMEVENGK